MLFRCFGYMACDIVDVVTDTSCIDKLQTKKVNPNKGKYQRSQINSKQSKLIKAIQANNLEKIVSLTVNGARADFVDATTGSTPFHYTIQNQHTNAFQYFVQQGVNANVQDAQGNTVLHYASQSGCIEDVQSLLVAGAKLGLRNAKGETALHLAAAHGGLELINVLLDAGADMYAKTYEGETPLEYARMYAKDWGQTAQELHIRMDFQKIQKQRQTRSQLSRTTSAFRRLSTILE
eukprot:TRINITY_DN2841_c0_g1_i10.p5 TRINITY_DN2841_c0_g1~~TRINITY_DN2841_c0_g1_i10.p5  ORF type:complete len:235 (+),score=22.34 TRINITY_DN2841_c0_g1_i10:270-974(+)